MTHSALHQSQAVTAAHELYPTPEPFTDALCDAVTLPQHIWECAAGQGHMVRVLRRRGHTVYESDITTGTDFLAQDNLINQQVEAVVTNPPFSLSTEFAERALELCGFVALLQPIYNLGGLNRYDRLWSHRPPAQVIIFANRMIVAGKTSHFNHCWIVWHGGTSNTTVTWARA
jgi:hypothetical protein